MHVSRHTCELKPTIKSPFLHARRSPRPNKWICPELEAPFLPLFRIPRDAAGLYHLSPFV